MSADVVKFENAAMQYERDRKVFAMRLAGSSSRAIATALGCSIDAVHASIVRMTGGVSPELRARTVMIELERLDDMQRGFYELALPDPENNRKPDAEAAGVVLRIQERRAKLLGLDQLPRGDAALEEMMRVGRETSTEKISRALDQLLGKTTMIEGKALPEPGDKGDG